MMLTLLGAGLLVPTSLRARRPEPQPGGSGTFAIVGVSVVDVVAGRVIANRTVVVTGRLIVDLVPARGARIVARARVIDGRGLFLMPGLWDMHVHTAGKDGPATLPLHVAYGVTGVRDMGADLDALLAARRRIDEGRDIGPRVVMAGPILDGPLGRPMPEEFRRWRIEIVDTARAVHVVDSLATGGADFIKVHERLSGPVYRAILRRAAARGLPVAGHIPTEVGAATVADAGQRSIEHLVNVPFACTAGEREALRARSALERLFGGCAPDDGSALTRRFIANRTWHTPTLVVQRRLVFGAGSTLGDPALRFLPLSVREMMRAVMPLQAPPPSPTRDRLIQLLDKRLAQVGALHRAGVGVLVGTDAPGVAPGWSVHEEMRLLVVAGLPTADALRAATLNPARYLGAADSLGSIEAGRIADLVLLRANPLVDIRNTQRIHGVVTAGRYHDRRAIDGILLGAAKRAGSAR